MSERGTCDFCGEREAVHFGEHIGPNGQASICEACADAAICDFLGDKNNGGEEE